MKKTINGCLLALTLCATSYAAQWEDDEIMIADIKKAQSYLYAKVLPQLKNLDQNLKLLLQNMDAYDSAFSNAVTSLQKSGVGVDASSLSYTEMINLLKTKTQSLKDGTNKSQQQQAASITPPRTLNVF